jgi:hypothetical protein
MSSFAADIAVTIGRDARDTEARYPLRVVNDLLFATIDGRVALIDTGSPVTFGAGDGIADDIHAEIVEFVGKEFDYLLGLDVLGTRELVFDVAAGWLEIGADSSTRWSPRIAARAAGHRLRCIVDTGASISYLPRHVVDGLPVTGRFGDFYPRAGRFEVETRDCTIDLGALRYTDRAAEIPPVVQPLSEGVDGIVGNRLVRAHRLRMGPAGLDLAACGTAE